MLELSRLWPTWIWGCSMAAFVYTVETVLLHPWRWSATGPGPRGSEVRLRRVQAMLESVPQSCSNKAFL